MKPIDMFSAHPAGETAGSTAKGATEKNASQRKREKPNPVPGNGQPGEGFNEDQYLQTDQAKSLKAGKEQKDEQNSKTAKPLDPNRSVSNKNDPSLKGDDE